jgi:hypothetical protein
MHPRGLFLVSDDPGAPTRGARRAALRRLGGACAGALTSVLVSTPARSAAAPSTAAPSVAPEALLGQAREALLSEAAQTGRLLSHSRLAQRVQALAEPVLRASLALRPDWPQSGWRIDLVAAPQAEGVNLMVFGRQDLVIQWPQRPEFELPEPLLSALIAHGVAHGLRDHAREALRWSELARVDLRAGPRFELIAEREADRDTTELLARAGLEPGLAWTLREALTGAPGPRSAWSLTHPEPPQAKEAIERFAARVAPLRDLAKTSP